MSTVVTFYSYKGGTGRSMALANVAWVLASAGAKVLVVDWDLEAPGLHRYFRPFLPDPELTRLESQGVIDVLVDFAGRLTQHAGENEKRTSPHWKREHADISKWSQRLLWPSGQDARTTLNGLIDFVPAGRQGPQYAKKVNAFDWARFYDQCDGGAFIEALRESMTRYDWVLVDSRTGISDTSGICTVQLPDILVVCFTLNYQSIDGAVAVASSAKAARGNRPLRVLPLPTRLDGNEEKLLKAMMGYARNAFAPLMEPHYEQETYWREMGVPYFSRYAYSEKLSPFEDQVNVSTSTLPSFERLTSYITDGAITTLRSLPETDRKEALAEFERLPGEEAAEGAPLQPSGRKPLSIRLRQLYLGVPNAARPIVLALFMVSTGLGIVWLLTSFRGSESEVDVVPRLIADAQQDLKDDKREHAALLIAEAAARLGPDAIVSPDGEPGKQIYDAFQLLQPLALISGGSLDAPWDVAFSGNGRAVAIAAQRHPALVFEFPPSSMTSGTGVGYSTAVISPDSKLVAAGGRDGSLNMLSGEDARRIWQWENPNPDSAWVTAAAFSPDGQFLSFATDTGQVYVSDTATGKTSRSFRLGDKALSLAFSPDSSYLAAGATSGNAFLWSMKSGKQFRLGPRSGPVSIAFAPLTRPNLVATAGAAGDVQIWSEKTDFTGPVNVPLDPGAKAMAFSDDGRYLAVGDASSVRVLQLAGGAVRPALTIDEKAVSSLAFNADGTLLAAGGNDGSVKIFIIDLRAYSRGVELQRVTVEGSVGRVTFSADGKYVGIGSVGGAWWTLVKPPGRTDTLLASDVRALACSQVQAGAALSAADWQRYYGADVPQRFTCAQTPPRSTR